MEWEEFLDGERDFKRDKRVDKEKLDWEWERHSVIYSHWGALARMAQSKVDRLSNIVELREAELKEVKAKMDLDIRSNPDGYGLGKITENVVASAILLTPEYKEALKRLFDAKEELIQAKDELAKFELAWKTIDQRRSALKGLTETWVGGYWDKPSISEEAKEKARKRMKERMSDELKGKMRKRGGGDD